MTHSHYRKKFAIATIFLAFACAGFAQDSSTSTPKDQKPADQAPAAAPAPPSAPAAPTPLPTPSTYGPLQLSPPINFEAGPLGHYSVNGAVTGIGLFQNNAVPGNNPQEGAFTNAFIFFQKPTGWFQVYVQAGAYDLPALGSAFISNSTTNSDLYGPVPVAYAKLVWKNTSVQFGLLPTLIGAEYTFSFQNMNIERGLLWNQENAINRGVQINQTFGKFTASLSYNDGFYSNRYSWLTGALTYTKGPHSLALTAGGNLGQTNWQSSVHPGAKQRHDLRHHLHLHEGALGRSTIRAVHRRTHPTGRSE